MRYDVQILRAMLRLARRRQAAADGNALLERVEGTRAELRAGLRRLEAQGLVERLGEEEARLTMAGLAIAVASVARREATPRPKAKKSARTRAA